MSTVCNTERVTAEPRAARRATSTDVARAAGLSRSTVSQILNGNEGFPAATRERVHAAAAALDYRPSRAGRALVTGLADIVVVVVPNATFGPHLQDSVDRITNASAVAGMSVVVRFGNRDEEATLLSVIDLRPAAVVDLGVFSNSQRERIEATGTRVVPRRTPVGPGEDADPVDVLIGRLQVRDLLRSASRRIVYVGLDDGRLDPFGPPRFAGIKREAAAHGMDVSEPVRVPLEFDGAREVLAPLLTNAAADPVGICGYNDDVATAVLAVARDLGLRVPEDVAVIGVDRTAVGQLMSPRLSTVFIDQPLLMDSLVQGLARLGGRRSAEDPPAEPLDPTQIVHLVRGETT